MSWVNMASKTEDLPARMFWWHLNSRPSHTMLQSANLPLWKMLPMSWDSRVTLAGSATRPPRAGTGLNTDNYESKYIDKIIAGSFAYISAK